MNGAQIVQTWCGLPCSYPREILNMATRLGLIVKDTTWGNDACPSFMIIRPKNQRVWSAPSNTTYPYDTPLLKVYHDTDDPEQRCDGEEWHKYQAVLITAGEEEDYNHYYEVETDREILAAVRQLLRAAGIPVGVGHGWPS
jgi:hypothetical protein